MAGVVVKRRAYDRCGGEKKGIPTTYVMQHGENIV